MEKEIVIRLHKFVSASPANLCYLLGLVMKAKGLRGRSKRVSQIRVSRISLAEYASRANAVLICVKKNPPAATKRSRLGG